MPLEQRVEIDGLPAGYLGVPDGSEKIPAKKAGTTGFLLTSDLQTLAKNYADSVLAKLSADLSGGTVTGGSSNNFTVLSARSFVSLTDGFSIAFTADRANTGASTLEVFAPLSTTQIPLKKSGGVALVSNDIDANAIYQATYDSVTGFFYLREGNAIAGLAPLASPALTGTPTAPTTAVGDNSTKIATTAAVRAELGLLSSNFSSHRNNVLTPHENLVVKYLTAATLSIAADAVVLFDSSGAAKRFSSISLTLDITASGELGLDTGSEGSSRWYHVHVVGKSDGTKSGILSSSASAPTLPSGYTYSGYVGAVYNDGSSNFIPFMQRGRVVSRSALAVLTGGTSTSFAAISLAAAVPETATRVIGYTKASSSSGSNLVAMVIAPAGSASTATYGFDIAASAVADATGITVQAFCLIETAQQIVYRASGTNAVVDLSVTGYEF